MLWEPSANRPKYLVTESYASFMLRQFKQPWLYALFLVTFAAYLLYAFRGYLRNRIWWDIR